MAILKIMLLLILNGWINIYETQGCDEVRIWQRSNFSHFYQIWNSTNVLSTLLLNTNSWKFLVLRLIDMHRQLGSIDKPFFLSSSTYHTNYSKNIGMCNSFCSVTCYTVLIWTMILLTLGNNIITII